jgi:adenine phosphoribosyltransferase
VTSPGSWKSWQVGDSFDLDRAIRKVPDFPKPGVLFYDITGILADPRAFAFCIERLTQEAAALRPEGIAAIESRGFVFAAPAAVGLQLPLILIRKKGKLPGPTYRARFALEYGEDQIEVQRDDVRRGARLLLVDDLIATGGTLKAACGLLEEAGATVAGIFAVVGLPFLNYQKVLSPYPVRTLIQYGGEKA